MADEEIVKILHEIRDLQRTHVELYKQALSNQQEAMEMQRKAIRRQRISLLVFAIIVFLGITISVMYH